MTHAGLPEKTVRVAKALGLRRPNQSVLRTANPSIAGMIFKLKELVSVEVVPASPRPPRRPWRAARKAQAAEEATA